MKLGQVVEHNKRNIKKKKNGESEAERLVLDLFLFFEKALYEVKANGHQFSFNTFR